MYGQNKTKKNTNKSEHRKTKNLFKSRIVLEILLTLCKKGKYPNEIISETHLSKSVVHEYLHSMRSAPFNLIKIKIPEKVDDFVFRGLRQNIKEKKKVGRTGNYYEPNYMEIARFFMQHITKKYEENGKQVGISTELVENDPLIEATKFFLLEIANLPKKINISYIYPPSKIKTSLDVPIRSANLAQLYDVFVSFCYVKKDDEKIPEKVRRRMENYLHINFYSTYQFIMWGNITPNPSSRLISQPKTP